ncbi:MAG: hypothetical protein WBA61_04245 [Aequorivita sp.]
MKQFILIIFLTTASLLISCKTENKKDATGMNIQNSESSATIINKFLGKWIDKKFESQVIEIAKDGENYLIKINDQKYPAQIKGGSIEISADSPFIGTIDKNDILNISGSEFIRFENSKKMRYIGKWDNEGFTLEISEKYKKIMNIKCIKGSWNKRDEGAEFRYVNGQIEFYNPDEDRTNYFRITKDGRLEQTYNETQSGFLVKIE